MTKQKEKKIRKFEIETNKLMAWAYQKIKQLK